MQTLLGNQKKVAASIIFNRLFHRSAAATVVSVTRVHTKSEAWGKYKNAFNLMALDQKEKNDWKSKV